MDSQVIHLPLCFFPHGGIIYDLHHRCRLMHTFQIKPVNDIFHNVHAGNQVIFLVNDVDSKLLGQEWIELTVFFSIHRDGSLGRCVSTRKDFHQGRFSCAVLSYQAVDFTRIYFKSDAGQSPNARKLLFDIFHGNNGFCIFVVTRHV